jgi:putative ABC transport system substrate-binding protein
VKNRRKILLAMGAGALGFAPLVSAQQNKVWRIGFFGAASASGYVKEVDAIREELRKLGYVEGRNIIIEYRWGENDLDRQRQMAAELVALKPDVIITHSANGVRATSQATTTIPIVMADGPDPAAMGFVASLARPGGNITGSTAFQSELAVKRLELLREVMPRLRRIAVISTITQANLPVITEHTLDQASKLLKIELVKFVINKSEEFPDLFANIAKQRLEAVLISENPVFNSNVGILAALSATHRLPAAGLASFAEAGGLLGYSANRPLLYSRSAIFADKILKGAKPGDLPIERATKFDLIINLKTAKALGINIPQSLVQRADRVIE